MAGQVVTSLVSSRGATTSCVVVAAHKLKASSSSSYSTSCSLPLTMVTTGFELGPKDRRRWRSMGGGSLSLCTERELREKKKKNNNKSMCHAVRPLSETEAAEGNVTIFEDSETFDRLLEEAGERLVVLDISTKTCGPCKMIFPKVVQLSIEYPDVVFLKINGDTNTDTRALMRKWGVRAVPNFRFFRNGELVHSHTGAKLDVLKAHFATHYTATIKT
ncbi:unnamed protein product [Sphagnum troendelagicum]|uniref:Thioredoxin domain-containing protein n=1 Tax=Sphagnum troendelagicum TaxID=128251 RepID=A0ABP0TB71_9BRYO